MRNHRGFTLIELLISLVVLGVVTASLFKRVTTSQQVSRAQTERVTLQSNVRAGAIVLPSELRQINAVSGGTAAQNDITSANIFEAILADEEHHIDYLDTQLELIEKLGEALYLSTVIEQSQPDASGPGTGGFSTQ